MLKYFFLSVSIAIIAIITSLLLHSSPAKIFQNQTKAKPDAFMEGVVATILDKEGNLSMTVKTPKMIHYAENDTTYFNQPIVTFYRESPLPWTIIAKHAKARFGMEEVNFWEDVVIHHKSDTIHPETVIKTESLLVKPKEQTANTEEPITLTQPNLNVSAIGLSANMMNGDIQLLSHARGQYAPNS